MYHVLYHVTALALALALVSTITFICIKTVADILVVVVVVFVAVVQFAQGYFKRFVDHVDAKQSASILILCNQTHTKARDQLDIIPKLVKAGKSFENLKISKSLINYHDFLESIDYRLEYTFCQRHTSGIQVLPPLAPPVQFDFQIQNSLCN